MLMMVDVDSTLYDADAHFGRVAKEMGIPFWERPYSWTAAHDLGVDRATLVSVFRRAHGHEEIMKSVPYENAADTLNNVSNLFGVKIAYVSDRHPQAEGALRRWLSEHGFLDDGQSVVCSKDKREWLRTWRPDVVIDDRVRTMALARFELGAQVLSIKHNHNINLTDEIEGIWICDDWEQINEVLCVDVLPMLV